MKSKNNTNRENVEVLVTKIDYIQKDVQEIKTKLESKYVTQDQFDPIKKLVYGTVSVVLLSVMGAIVTLVISK